MTIHSAMPLQSALRGARLKPRAPEGSPGPKRDALLRAAIDVFAERGYFHAEVAAVARAAGVAAGTVYLYFRSKDDLLTSIFERTMREAIADGRACVAAMAGPEPGRRGGPETARRASPVEQLRAVARVHLERL